MAKYYSTKTYGTDRGLSCCFRQWRADHSHCSTLHGYSIGIKLVFESETLDDKNWCMDFGGLKSFKAWADHMFDHTLLIAEDDPRRAVFEQLAAVASIDNNSSIPHVRGAVCDLRIVPGVGCEMFAKMAYEEMERLLVELKGANTSRYPVNQGVRLKSVEVFEHGANSAIYEG
jgi:6-pyruvoyltetrahydropterin/6-carboxytetrahydropterin synthase